MNSVFDPTARRFAHLNRALLLAFVLGMGTVGTAFDTQAQETGNFQIIKATETVAWRLNKKTGEIAVCKLDGDTMICSSSATAVTRENGSYEEYKAGKDSDEQARQAHEMAILDKVFEFFKSFISMVLSNKEN